MKYTRKQKERMKSLVNKYVGEAKYKMFIGYWTVDTYFYDCENRNTIEHYIKWQSEYYKGTLSIDIEDAIDKMKNKTLKDLIYHEVGHLVSAELVEASHDRYASEDKLDLLKEQLTERIKNIALYN